MPAIVQRKPEQKKFTITSKRQFTIPQKFYVEPGFDREAICAMGEGMLIIQPAANVSGGGEFAEQILADLIAEGYTGQELLDEFKTRQTKVRPAVKNMLETARTVAQDAVLAHTAVLQDDLGNCCCVHAHLVLGLAAGQAGDVAVHQEGGHAAVEYSLADRGRSLIPALESVYQWAEGQMQT